MKRHVKQGVALTVRNTTGPPRAAPGELRCICECYRRRQTPTSKTILARLLYTVGHKKHTKMCFAI